jgi:hypothetical protein
VVDVVRDEDELHGNADAEHQEERARVDLALNLLARLHVDDPEKQRRAEVRDEAHQVRERLAPRDEKRTIRQHRELFPEARLAVRLHFGQPFAVHVLALAPERAAVRRRPGVEHSPDAGERREILVDQIEDELGGVGVDGGGEPDFREVRAHLLGLAEVRDSSHAQHHGVVEAREHARGRLVDRAHHGDVLRRGDGLQKTHHAHRARGVHP